MKYRRQNKEQLVLCLLFITMNFLVTALLMLSSNARKDSLNVESFLQSEVNKTSLRSFLRSATEQPRHTGSSFETNLIDWIRETWEAQGLDVVETVTYDVKISRPHKDLDNTVTIESSTGEVVHTSSATQEPVEQYPQQDWAGLLRAFNAYAKAGTVLGDVVYCNYGREEDYEALAALNITVTGRIALARYGKLFRGQKQRLAEAAGAVGLILYSDPTEVAPANTSTFPQTVYAPGGGVQLGSLRLKGDLFTPGMPALDWVKRLPEEEVDLPGIPVQPIGYSDAMEIISRLSGPVAPLPFQGGLPLQYRTGPGLQNNETTRLVVHNTLEMTPVTNVVGVIWGREERDRFVLVGNHHDAWNYGGLDPFSGTAVLLELTRLYARLVQEHDWRGRRTLVFLSWSAEEDGLVGSTEFAEHYAYSLGARSVAYLNMDLAMIGNSSILSSSMPLLYNVMEETAKKVPAPPPSSDGDTLYDLWLTNYPDPARPDKPYHDGLSGARSDHRAFMFQLGIPCGSFVFLGKPGEDIYPLYHMAYDTYELVTQFMDPSMAFHEASARFWGLMVHQFASASVLPLSVKAFADYIVQAVDQLQVEYQEDLQQLGILTNTLEDLSEDLAEEAALFETSVALLHTTDVLAVRAANDAMQLSSRALLDARGLPGGRITDWHQVIGVSSTDANLMEAFPGIRDLLRQRPYADDVVLAEQLRRHIDNVCYRILSAKTALNLHLWP